MQFKTINRQHSHQFDQGQPQAQKKILWATILTGTMMVLEIWGGYVFNSMALLADGWHMSSHMLALGLAYVAYKAARHYAQDTRFSFGTWKIQILTAYSSAILLLLVAFSMTFQSIERLLNPVQIHYQEAISIAILGLVINLLCAWLLQHQHHHHHGHSHNDHQAHHHHSHNDQHHKDHQAHNHHHHSHNDHQADKQHQTHDLNQKAAFLHVIADAVTSVFAIIALIAGRYWGWTFLDALLGIVGAVLVAKWSLGLIRETAKTLIDADMDHPIVDKIKHSVEQLNDSIKITDIHVWKVAQDKFSCILALEAQSLNADAVRAALAVYSELAHISVEINAPTAFIQVPRETQKGQVYPFNNKQI